MQWYERWVRRGLSLEAFKFAVYLSVPVSFVIWFANPRRIRHYLEQVRACRERETREGTAREARERTR